MCSLTALRCYTDVRTVSSVGHDRLRRASLQRSIAYAERQLARLVWAVNVCILQVALRPAKNTGIAYIRSIVADTDIELGVVV